MEIIEQIGAFAGLAAVLGLAVLSVLYFSQARDVKRLREWAGRAPERVAEGAAADQLARGVTAQPVPKVVQQQTGAAKPAAASAAGAAPATANAKPGAPPAVPGTPGVKGAPTVKPGEAAKPAEEAGDEQKVPAGATAATAAGAATPAGAASGAAPAGQGADGPSASAGTTTPPKTPAGPPPAGRPPTPPKPPPPPSRPVPPRGPAGGTPGRPTIPLRGDREAAPSQTAILRPRGQEPWYRRLLASPRYLVLVIAGVLIVGGALAFGVVQLVGDDDGGATSADSAPGPGGGGDTGDEPPDRSPVNPADVTVSVLNGTTIPGLAAQIGDRVEAAGFQLGNVDNSADQGARNESVVLYAEGAEREAQVVQRRLNINQREPMDPESQALAGDATVVVITGPDLTP